MLSSHPGYSAGRPGTRFLINLLKDAAKLWVGRAELFSYVRLLLQTARCDLQAFCDSDWFKLPQAMGGCTAACRARQDP